MTTALLRAEEVAPLLALSKTAVYRLAAKGVLPSVRWGRVVRFDPEAIEHWIREHSAGNGAQP